ncbi:MULTISPECIES: cell wall-binding repeat-containing protein [unclassified Agromyces]|uniref:cell wall-binding repeat-containing protein n=1 Tax=unclassified Agromyces TaxID=2639701 RepID=UPI00301486DB
MAPAPPAGMRRAAVLVASLALLASGIAPAHAAEPALPDVAPPPTASEATSDDAASGLLARPAEGTPASFLSGSPVAGEARAKSFSAESSDSSAATATASISGTITHWAKGASQGGLPTGEALAVKWDDASGDWLGFSVAQTDASGAYTLAGLPAGEYVVLAYDLAAGTPLIPEFWEDAQHVSWANVITLADGESFDGANEELEPLQKWRIAGKDRYETAVLASQTAFGEGVPCAFIATGADFPDALSAGPAAAHCGGPLLLVPGTTIPPIVLEELQRLAPERIVIAGSAAVVSSGVESALKGIAPVTRYAGTDRYDTSRRIVAGEFGTAQAAWVATGANFPDALSASGAAAAADVPVLIVPGSSSTLDVASASALTKLGAVEVGIAGSAAVVSNGIQAAIGKLSTAPEVVRLAGADRYSTALAIVEYVWTGDWAIYGFTASGSNFPDALAGAPVAGWLQAPLYITSEACTSEGIQAQVAALQIADFFVLGKYQPLYYDSWEPFRSC